MLIIITMLTLKTILFTFFCFLILFYAALALDMNVRVVVN